MLMWWVCLAVFWPLCVRASDYEEYILEEADILAALEKIINFLSSDMDRVNVDGLLGTIITEAQLNLVIQKINIRCILFDKIIDLQNKFHIINKQLKHKLKNSSEDYDKIYINLLQTSVWELDHDFDKSIVHLQPYNWTNISFDYLVRNVVFNGPPDGKQSENCILELDKYQITDSEYHDCLPSTECIQLMSPTNTSNGYPLTHKLLYIQLARALKCRINDRIVENKIEKLCSRILQEYRSIDGIQNKNAVLQDLYLEQMVLCGMEGFSDFLTDDSRHLLLDWQSSHGCYGDLDVIISIDNPRWRTKRNTSYMKFGCESHITGLAAAALSIHLNYLVATSSHDVEADDEIEDFSNILLLNY